MAGNFGKLNYLKLINGYSLIHGAKTLHIEIGTDLPNTI